MPGRMPWASLRPRLTVTSIAAEVRRLLAAVLKEPGTVVADGKPVIATLALGLANIDGGVVCARDLVTATPLLQCQPGELQAVVTMLSE